MDRKINYHQINLTHYLDAIYPIKGHKLITIFSVIRIL